MDQFGVEEKKFLCPNLGVKSDKGEVAQDNDTALGRRGPGLRGRGNDNWGFGRKKGGEVKKEFSITSEGGY